MAGGIKHGGVKTKFHHGAAVPNMVIVKGGEVLLPCFMGASWHLHEAVVVEIVSRLGMGKKFHAEARTRLNA